MSDLDDIRDILGFEPYRGAPIDWEAASQALGARIPSDFRELINATGAGKIGYDTLLLQPFAINTNYDQIRRHHEWIRDLEIIWEEEKDFDPEDQTKPLIFNEPDIRPILWGASGLGFNLYWVARNDTDPSTWQIAVEPARGGQWEFHPGTATNLLLRLLRGEAASLYLRSLCTAEQHFFTPDM
ncbi:hypothetical protein OHB12_02670 [Nocardia sp. NBC_01730]|uniref:hypothetical protein n=1 Tax=Nocardia sp. NBC_01730 TaxID=2975998 RepID=UPI002E14F782|nr:hypothetical protein OHB12_02670 [Nocardia sp. NBC_01730]